MQIETSNSKIWVSVVMFEHFLVFLRQVLIDVVHLMVLYFAIFFMIIEFYGS